MHLALEAVDEARANRAVDHAGGQRTLLGGTSLTLEVAAGDAADRVHLLDEVDGQREEVVVLLFLGNDGGDEHGGLALGHEHSARGLLGQLTGFEAVLLAVQLEGLDDLVHVFLSFSSPCLPCAAKLLRCAVLLFPPITSECAVAHPTAYTKARGRRAFE